MPSTGGNDQTESFNANTLIQRLANYVPYENHDYLTKHNSKNKNLRITVNSTIT